MKNKTVQPFIRYVGGKRWYTKLGLNQFPKSIENYHEPFLGSGAIYFFLKNNLIITGKSYLSDVNSDLIATFNQIKCNTSPLISALDNLENTIDQYYEIRKLSPINELDIAARFLFLNRTSFGGIYRVNKKGEFNVPYGHRKYKNLFDYKNINAAGQILSDSTVIKEQCFSQNKITFSGDDFFCLDPPYLGSDDKFNRYNKIPFDSKKSHELIELVEKIASCNSRFLLFVGNNAEFAKKIKHLGECEEIERSSNLSFKKKNKNKKEIIIKNY